MVSLFRILQNLIHPNRIREIWRLPLVKPLRAHLLGLTIGFVMCGVSIGQNLLPITSISLLIANIVVLLVFGLVTVYSGLFFFFSVVFLVISAFLSSEFATAYWTSGQWYFLGYLFGGLLALLYNDLVYVYVNVFEKKRNFLAFAYDSGSVVNIIKSPIEGEERAYRALVEAHSALAEDASAEESENGHSIYENQKLYHYHLDNPPNYPFTIALVANPKIFKRDGDRRNESDYEVDPIANDLELFLRGVDNALQSFGSDEILGQDEIWSRVRIVTIFDPSLVTESGFESALIQENQEDRYMDGSDKPVENNMLVPLKQLAMNVERILEREQVRLGAHAGHENENHEQEEGEGHVLSISDLDVIFALSASATHERATAHYSDWLESNEDEPEPEITFPDEPIPPGQYTPYDLDFDPCDQKNRCYDEHGEEVVQGNVVFPELNSSYYRTIHEHWARCPGRAAINVLGARRKTYIHEFAHAMSSAYHGQITDTYYDLAYLEEPASEVVDPFSVFYINRLERSREEKRDTNELIPRHKEFARYNCNLYDSDMAHPSADENWIGYFPDRIDASLPGTMDRTYGYYRFNELVSAFIYDRLVAKINRRARPETSEEDVHHAADAVEGTT